MSYFLMDDLHLECEEGSSHTIKNIPSGKVLFLAGDIFTPWSNSLQHEDVVYSFFDEVSSKFDYVLMVLGNHEHYGGYYIDTANKTREYLENYKNVHILDNEYFQVDDLLVFGNTFWFDANNKHPQVMWDIQRGMNDHYKIAYSLEQIPGSHRRVKFLVEDAVEHNEYARKQLKQFYRTCREKNLKPVVLTHHAPSFDLCVESRYKFDTLSYAYANTGLEETIVYLEDKNFWLHGHMHRQYYVSEGNTNIYCNARGYQGIDFVREYEAMELNFD